MIYHLDKPWEFFPTDGNGYINVFKMYSCYKGQNYTTYVLSGVATSGKQWPYLLPGG